MILDGIKLIEGSNAENLTVKSGTSFPSLPAPGELFFRTDITGGRLYVYSNTEWILIGTGDGGGSGTVTLASLGLENVDNTHDIDKPISTDTQAALDLKANITDLVDLGLLYNVKNVNGNYSVIQSDVTLNTLIRVISPVGVTSYVTLPTDAQVTCPIGTTLVIASGGFGPVTLQASPGASVNSPQSLTIDRQYGRVLVVKTNTNTWEIDGQLVAQVQFTVIPIDYSGRQVQLLDNTFEPLNLSTEIKYQLSTNNGHTLWFDSSYPTDNYLYSLNDTSSNISTQYGTAAASYKYFKAVKISGNANLISNPGSGLSIRKTLGEGEWGQWILPSSASEPPFLTSYTLPHWEWNQQLSDTTPNKFQIFVSSSASDTDIIGSFFFQYDPILLGYNKFNFSGTTTAPYFWIDEAGKIISSETNNTNFGSIIGNMQAGSGISQTYYEHNFFKVTAIYGVTINPGSGILGTNYTDTGIRTVTWGWDSNFTGSVYLVERLRDLTGSIIPVAGGIVKLKTAPNYYLGGYSFNDPTIIDISQTPFNIVLQNMPEKTVYFKFSTITDPNNTLTVTTTNAGSKNLELSVVSYDGTNIEDTYFNDIADGNELSSGSISLENTGRDYYVTIISNNPGVFELDLVYNNASAPSMDLIGGNSYGNAVELDFGGQATETFSINAAGDGNPKYFKFFVPDNLSANVTMVTTNGGNMDIELNLTDITGATTYTSWAESTPGLEIDTGAVALEEFNQWYALTFTTYNSGSFQVEITFDIVT